MPDVVIYETTILATHHPHFVVVDNGGVTCTFFPSGGRTAFIRTLGDVLNVSSSTNPVVSFARVSQEGAQRGVLFLLDDVQVLSGENNNDRIIFEIIRTLHDQGLSFVLCGNRKIRERVTRVDDEELYQQFASRASVFDVPDQFSRKDVKAVIDAAYKGRLSEEQFEYLFTIANEFYGSLRLVIRILEVAVPKANELNSPLTLEMLKETSKYFLSDRKPEFKDKTKKRRLRAKINLEHSEVEEKIETNNKLANTCSSPP